MVLADISIAAAHLKAKYALEVARKATRAQLRDELVEARIDATVTRLVAETLLRQALRAGTLSLTSAKRRILDEMMRKTRDMPRYLQYLADLADQNQREASALRKRRYGKDR